MTGLPLPPAEPPAENIAGLLERLRTAREHLVDARRQVAMVETALGDVETLTPTTVMYFRVERRVAQNRVVLWTREVRGLERRGRAMGLAL